MDESASAKKKLPIHLQSSQNRLLIKNGKVVNADGVQDADIFIEAGCVKEIGRNLIVPGGTRVIDARGKVVIPGGVDPHTRLESTQGGVRSVDDFYTGTKAAVAGGTTTIIDYAIPGRSLTKKERPDNIEGANGSLLDALIDTRRRADSKVCCDYSLHVALTSWTTAVRGEMDMLVNQHGVNSFQAFMTFKDTWMLRDPDLYTVFENCKRLGAIAQVHAENGDIIAENAKKLLEAGVKGPEGHELSRPEEVEAEAVNRACVLANQVNCPLYVVSVMGKSAAQVIAQKRAAHSTVFGETLAAAIGTDGSAQWNKNWKLAAAHVTIPPLRPDPSTPGALLDALAADDLSVLASANCTFSQQQKQAGVDDFTKIPYGVNGVEERMAILWEKGVQAGKIDLPRFVALTSTNAAKIFNIYPKKGCIAAGSDADIVIWDPNKIRTIAAKTHSLAVDSNIFEGIEVHGAPEYVIVKGRVCVDEGDLKVVQGYGAFVPAAPFPPTVYELVKRQEARRERRQSSLANQVGSTDAIDNDVTPTNSPTHSTATSAEVNGVSAPAVAAAISGPQFPRRNLIEGFQAPPPIGGDSAPSSRPLSRTGSRNLQESTFSLAGDLPCEKVGPTPSIRVKAPPGGFSAGLW